jgi:hypothetical protein
MLSKTACPEAFPLWDPSEPSSPPSCGYVQHQEWSAVWRSAWLRGARAKPWVWRGRRQVAPGASGGTLPGCTRKNALCFSDQPIRLLVLSQ